MGVTQMFADTPKAQRGDNVVHVTIPKDIVEEFGIEPSDDVLWTAQENEGTATIHSPGEHSPQFPSSEQ